MSIPTQTHLPCLGQPEKALSQMQTHLQYMLRWGITTWINQMLTALALMLVTTAASLQYQWAFTTDIVIRCVRQHLSE